ncbi:glycoside hydrolase N-terminal domain-containing protein [Nonomuraea ferruginea]
MLPPAWTAAARAASAPPPEVSAANDLALWYDESAGTDWLRALPIGNGRLGAMVFGNVDTERLQLNEDTVWAGGPYDQSNPPEGRRRWARSGNWSSRTSGARPRR